MPKSVREILKDVQHGAVSHIYPFDRNEIVENSPFRFVGKWFETTFYIGGKIDTVGEQEILTRTYTVLTRFGKIENIKSTDLYEYAVEEQVTLIKRWDGKKGMFFFKDISNYKNWTIIPVDFVR
jgi:hypothetical protein